MVEQYHDSLQTNALEGDLQGAVNLLLQHAGYVTVQMWDALQRLGKQFVDEQPVLPVMYGADFSMAGELEAQIRAVRAVRDRIMSADGQLSKDISTREAKEVISSGSTLLSTLMKHHEKVVNMERLRLLESSVVEALTEVDEELKEVVLQVMEKKLANVR